MKTMALIPARAGSKGIPGKNSRSFCGRPLMAWSIDMGLATCDRTFVSTEDPDLALLAGQLGAEVIDRPAHMATDEAPMLPVVKHALAWTEHWKPDVIVLLQPTSPLRTRRMVQDALNLLDMDSGMNIDAVASVVPIPAHWSPDLAVTTSGPWIKVQRPRVTRRQAGRQFYTRDGSVYAFRRRTIRGNTLFGSHTAPLLVDPRESVTIDEEEDWLRAEAMFEAQHMRRKVSA